MRNVYLYLTLFVKDHKIEGEEREGNLASVTLTLFLSQFAVME